MAARILSRRLTSELHRSHLNSLIHGNYCSALNFSTLTKIPPQNLTNSSTSRSESHFRNRSLFSFEQLRNFSTQDHDDKKNTNTTMAASILSRRLANKPHFSHLKSLIHGNNISAPNLSPLAKISPQIHASFSTFGNKFQYRNPSMLENTHSQREVTMMHGFTRSKYHNILQGSANFSTKSLISSSSSSKVDEEKELESCDTLYPDITRAETQLRWGFIRKVYGILSAQIGLTAAVASLPVLYPPLAQVFLSNKVMCCSLLASPLVILFPLIAYQDKHPVNLAILGLFTACQGLALGLCCSVTEGPIVLQALTLTSTAFASLTAYTFWASKRGKDFSFLGPFLFSSLVGLVGSGILQIWYPLSSPAESVYGAVSALTFSGYIVYNTQELIKRFRYDQYISAALSLYLNILNLFLTILRELGKRRR